MNCNKSDCACTTIIVAIIAGVILGVLSALGFVSTGIIFWAYLAIGAAGALLAPLYATITSLKGGERCFCKFRTLFTVATVGTIIATAVGLIVAGIASTTVVAIVVAFATLFAVMEIVTALCITKCICGSCQ